MSRVPAAIWMFCGWLWISASVLADWPAYRHDAQRSGVTEESLPFPLAPAWTYVCPQPPRPAWPDPFRLVNRMDFDYAPALVIAGGLVCFGSSSDDTVRALDAKTGAEKWHFIAGGPVRFAPAFAPSTALGAMAGKPQIAKGRVYFASDDGMVYCLEAATGKLAWKFNAAPADERFVGNHRMISRWPIRTGVLVDSGVVYAVAGMWPAEGIFVYALEADTGKVRWCNDTVGGTPQGALLASRDILLVPNGNAKTTPLNRHTGALMQWPLPPGASGCAPGWLAGQYAQFEADPRAGKPAGKDYLGFLRSGRGGTWATLDGDTEYSFAMHRSGELFIEPYSLTNGLAGRAWGPGDVPQLSIERQSQLLSFQTHERGKVSAIVNKGKLYARKAYGLALAGDTLLLGHEGAVTAQSATNANEIWRADVKGEARDLAVAAGRLFVSTSEGVIYAFAPGGGVDAASSPRALRDAESGDGKADGRNQNPEQSEIRNLKSQIAEGGGRTPSAINHQPSTIFISHLHSSGMDRGFALVLGDADGQMSMELAAQTQLRVIVALSDESAVSALRERLLATTAWYGSRIHVQHVERLDRLPFAQYFANAVIVAADEDGRDGARPSTHGIVHGGPRSVVAGLLGQELYRVLRPCGGILLFPGLKATEAEALVKETGASESEIRAPLSPNTEHLTPNTEHRPPNTVPSVVRGKLLGALDWDVPKFKADRRVKWPLRPLWFGGPATRQAQNDVEGANSRAGLVVANGRYFMFSERALTAVDAYNGAVLWSRPIPEAWPSVRDVDGALYQVSDSVAGQLDRARTLRVNNDSVYLVLGQEFFKGKGEGTIQLDAHTGEQQKICGPFNSPTLVPLKTSLTWLLKPFATSSINKPPDAAALKMPADDDQGEDDPLLQDMMKDIDRNMGEMAKSEKRALAGMEENDGQLTLSQDRSGLRVELATRDASVSKLDAWELYFDFRPVDERYGLYERVTFHIRVVPARDEKTPAAWRLITGPDCPEFDVTGARDAQGAQTTLRLAWAKIEKWIGAKPASFDFAATLNAHNGGRDEPIARRHLFGDWAADGINNGWARIVLDHAQRVVNEATLAAGNTTPPAIMAKNFKDGFNWGPTGYEAQKIDESVQDAPGIHPLTGEPVPKIYGIAPVCGGAYLSATLISQAFGLYDLADNSGRRPCYPGVKTGCTTPQLAALGMFLISEEWGHCVCNQSFRTSLALAPAERRLNEDWAWFYDRDVDTRVRQAFVNLGAPGDRRDEKGNLWLGFPRNSVLQTPEDYPTAVHSLPYPLGMRDAQTGLWSRRAIRGTLWLPLDVDVITQAIVAVSSQRASSNTEPRSRSAATVGSSAAIVESSVAALRERGPASGTAAPLPVEAETAPSFGPYRFNADRVRIQGTDRPWIYGSGYRSIRKATLKLDFFKPLVSLPASATIAVDGKLDEASWGDAFQSTNGVAPLLPYNGTRVAFRHDSRNLYVGLLRPPITVRRMFADQYSRAVFTNEPRPWRATTNSGPDAISNGDNWWRLIVSGDGGKGAAHFTVTPAGARADALQDLSRTNLDTAWNPAWQSAVQTNEHGWSLEMAIPWTTLVEAGLNKDQLAVNFLMNDPGLGTEALTYLGLGGYDRCSNFTPLGLGKPAVVPTRAFTVRLHFAEPDADAKPGQRVFDVLLQGRQVLTGFDIVKEAGGARKAVVKEFLHVLATNTLTLAFNLPAGVNPSRATVPILNGLELTEEKDTEP